MNYLDARYFSWIFLGIIWQVNAIFRAVGNSKLASRIMMSWLLVKSIPATFITDTRKLFSLIRAYWPCGSAWWCRRFLSQLFPWHFCIKI